MSAAHYTVRVSVPGEPQQVITTIASGPAAAVSAVQYHLIGKHEASAWKRARFSCRSGGRRRRLAHRSAKQPRDRYGAGRCIVRIYLNHGRYHLRQSDAGKGFATIEVPFGASPKEAFVDWLNETFAAPPAATEAGAEPAAEVRGIAPTSEPEAASTPLPPPPAHGGIDGQAVMEWALDRATNAEIENLFAALGARLRAAHRRAPA